MENSLTIATLKERITWIEDKIQWAENVSEEFKLKLANDQTDISKSLTTAKLIEIETFSIRLKNDLISFRSHLRLNEINEAVTRFEDSYNNVINAHNEVTESLNDLSNIL